MPDFEDFIKRQRVQRIKTVVNRLADLGWIEKSFFHDVTGEFDIKWTDKGKERIKWMNEITKELHGNHEDIMALAVLCAMYAPK